MSVELQTVRNIGIAAHIDAGKTTTTERILFYAGRTHRMGDVDDGTTTTDFDEEEQKRGITIYSAAVTLTWKGYTINLIDTPGHVDFTAEVERSLRVLDGMVAVFDAREGVEAQSETVWRQADKYHVPRICFINKMDRIGADFERAVASLNERLHVHPIVMQLPMGWGPEFKGIIDLVDEKAIHFHTEDQGATYEVDTVPPEFAEAVREGRGHLIEAAAEFSEPLMEKYLHGEPVTRDDIVSAIRKAVLSRSAFPVFCGSSLKYVGVQQLLDAVCDFLPSPLDIPAAVGADPVKLEVERECPCRSDAPTVALIFKIIAEKPVDLFFMRVYSGKVKPNSRLLNPSVGEKENITRIYRMFAKRREQIDEAQAGDIVAVVGPKKTLTGHTLCDPHRPVVLESIVFPETVISVSVEPKSSKDRDKLVEALAALTRQDPTLAVKIDTETNQTLISGMGELHLEVAARRLVNDMNVEVLVGKPRVSYRETVTTTGEAEGRFHRQFAGRTHQASIRLRLDPAGRTSGRSSGGITHRVPDGKLLPEYIRSVETGIRDASLSGILGSYLVIDWSATILDGEQHETESSELAFENAGRIAFYEAMKVATPVLLEPIMHVEVVTPEEYFGTIMTDLSARRAVIRDTVARGSNHIITVEVPLAQMFGYVTRLRSLSQGRATASMEPSHYAAVSAEEMKTLIGA